MIREEKNHEKQNAITTYFPLKSFDTLIKIFNQLLTQTCYKKYIIQCTNFKKHKEAYAAKATWNQTQTKNLIFTSCEITKTF